MIRYKPLCAKLVLAFAVSVMSWFIVMPACLAKPVSVSLNFVQEDIRVLLHTLSMLSGTNMIIDESVAKESPTITIRLDNVPFDEAVDLIAQAKGLTYHKTENAIIFERSDIGDSAIVRLQYVNALDVKNSLAGATEGLKLKVDTDIPSNALVLTGSSLGISRVKGMVGELDKKPRQVLMEAKVVAISKSATKDLGIQWSWDETPKTYDYEPATFSYDASTKTYIQQSPEKITRHTSVGNGYSGIISFGRSPDGLPYEFYYSAKINALVSNGNAKILSQPKVVTVNGKEARILVGDRIPVQTSTVANGTTSTSTTYVETGIKLAYTPVVGADGQITAKVHTEVSTPQLVSDIKQYQITTREAETNVRMKDGETLVIGGLIGSQQSKTVSKIPLLGDLPILGSLFKNVSNSGSEAEIVIFLTARVVE
ncbi:type II and III secretion system protein|uniref:Type IV pilus assembly protein PilQ n=1 Tax=Dendrosporobacter quercicolus TaxID=146817 RepID=A0A1G9M8L8_9FIRM|nr:secretin N-terminal domain-containing protein [Dendrosporobacter quercicolus]NSL46957.1 type II and III secretion system protein [Dendrosporobacter quercicolus DSM 1736]SDL70474.1 type IV pilus assembly protein PilQ [Dendrosporobacter quercicolus]